MASVWADNPYPIRGQPAEPHAQPRMTDAELQAAIDATGRHAADGTSAVATRWMAQLDTLLTIQAIRARE